jgi:hypothetical protein
MRTSLTRLQERRLEARASTKTMARLFGADFNATDAAKTGAWLGEDCK